MSADDDLEAALHARHHRHNARSVAGVSLYGGIGAGYGPTGQLTTTLSPAQFPDQVDTDDDDGTATSTGAGTTPAAPAGGAT